MADTRVPVLGYWVCSPSFTRLYGSGGTKTTEGGERLPSFASSQMANLGSPIGLSCDVKACDAAEQRKLLAPPLRAASSVSLLSCVPTGTGASRICNHEGPPVFLPCLMKRQNNRFAYTETGVVTGLTPIDLGYVKGAGGGEVKPEGGRRKKEKFMSNSCLEVFRL